MSNNSPKTKLQITITDIQKISDYFQSAPPPPKVFTVRESLIELLPTLQEARARGHTIESIREILNGIGIKVTTRHVIDALRSGESVKKPIREKPIRIQQKTKLSASPEARLHQTTGQARDDICQGGDNEFTA